MGVRDDRILRTVFVFFAVVGCATQPQPRSTATNGASSTAATQSAETTVSATTQSAETTASRPAPSAKAAEKPKPKRLDGVKHHALAQRKVGFYGVLLPEGYEESTKAYPVVVILHGSGSTEVAHGRLANKFGRDGVIYVLPRAPHAHQGVFFKKKLAGWTAWPSYPEAWGEWDAPGFPKAELKNADPKVLYVEWIASAIADARKRYRTTEDGAVVFGHSQGAAFAHALATRHPEIVKAYFAYAGYYDESTEDVEDGTAAQALQKHGVQVGIAHHEDDRLVKFEQSRRLVEYLEKHGVEHNAHLLAAGSHSITPEVTKLAQQFVRRWCCGDVE